MDNSNCSRPISEIRLGFIRTVSTIKDKPVNNRSFYVEEELVYTTTAGMPARANEPRHLIWQAPRDVIEKHKFEVNSGKTMYGSILAPSYTGEHFYIDYKLRLSITHKTTFGTDTHKIEFPIDVICL